MANKKLKNKKIKKYGFGGVSALRGPNGEVQMEQQGIMQPMQSTDMANVNSFNNPTQGLYSNSETGFGANSTKSLEASNLGGGPNSNITINNQMGETKPNDVGQQENTLFPNTISAKKGKMISFKMKKRGGGMAMAGMGAALSQGGEVRGVKIAIKGARKAKMY